MTEHAIQMDRYGGPDVLEWRVVRRRPPGADEVRIRTLYAAVNRADIEIRRGEWPIVRADPFPYTPGLEVVGEVATAGTHVDGVRPGDRVITMMQHLGGIWGERPGGYGELVTVAAGAVAVVPPDVDPERIAALGLAAVTASEGLARLALAPGQRVVVHGASGGVGSAAVMLAAAGGAEVIAVVHRSGRENDVRRLGAADVVCLEDQTLLDATGPRSVDAVLETTGRRTFAQSVAVLRRGGRLCLVGAVTGGDLDLSAWDLIQELTITGWSSENLTGAMMRRHVDTLVELLRTGDLPTIPTHVVALADASAAHARIESGELTGRTLLTG